MYLVQALGSEIGYRFGWYVFGPYSADLTRDAYEFHGLDSLIKDESAMDPQELKKLKSFFRDVRALGNREKDEEYWLELIASLHFLKTRAVPRCEKLDDALSRLSIAKLQKFAEDNVRTGWKLLAKYVA